MKYIPTSKLKSWRKANTPYLCPISNKPMSFPVVDHAHIGQQGGDGCIRGVVSDAGNQFLGALESKAKQFHLADDPKELRELVMRCLDYIDNPPVAEKIIHPSSIKPLRSRFSSKKKAEQIITLEGLRAIGRKVTTEIILSLKNNAERVALYEKLIKASKMS